MSSNASSRLNSSLVTSSLSSSSWLLYLLLIPLVLKLLKKSAFVIPKIPPSASCVRGCRCNDFGNRCRPSMWFCSLFNCRRFFQILDELWQFLRKYFIACSVLNFARLFLPVAVTFKTWFHGFDATFINDAFSFCYPTLQLMHLHQKLHLWKIKTSSIIYRIAFN